jgi:hypothetical protein
MTEHKQRIAIAEFCHFVKPHGKGELLWKTTDGRNIYFDPLNDMNAMHEAKKLLTYEQRRKWGELCVEMTNKFPEQHIVLYCKNPLFGEQVFSVANVTAVQEAELLLRTLGKWEES